MLKSGEISTGETAAWSGSRYHTVKDGKERKGKERKGKEERKLSVHKYAMNYMELLKYDAGQSW